MRLTAGVRISVAAAIICLGSVNCGTPHLGSTRPSVPTIVPLFTRIIAPDSMWVGIPDISPDNRWVVYVARTRDSSANIWLVGAQGGTPLRLTSGRFVDIGPIWFPTGDRIVFVSNRPSRTDGTGSLMALSINPQTGQPIGPPSQITKDRAGGFGAPSPDGRSVAYPAQTVDGISRVMVVSTSGGAAREIISYRADWPSTGPEFLWSSDGQWIFHVLRRAGPAANVFMRVAVANGAAQELGVLAAQVAHPDQSGRFVLLRIPRDTGASVGLTRPPNHEIATIDGQPIARFVAPRGMWIYRFTADGRSLIAQQADSSGASLWRLDIGNLLRAGAGGRR